MPLTPLVSDGPGLSEDHPPQESGLIPQRTIAEKAWRRDWMVLAIGLLVLLVPFSVRFQHNGGPMDEGTLLVYPEMIQRGAAPYRDFETFYGPANPYLLAGIYAIFGLNIDVERTTGLLYRAIILVAFFGVIRRWGTSIAMGCMLLTGFLLLPLGVVAYAWIGAIACALLFVWAMAAPEENWRCLAGGLFGGLALSFRADIGPALILAAWALLYPLTSSQRLRTALGAAIGLAPYPAVLLLSGFEPMLNNLFLYPVILSGPARRLPLFSAEPDVLRIFFALILAAAANIVVWWLAVWANPKEARNRTLLALALLGAGVIPQAWQRADFYHVMFVAFLVFGILPLTLFSGISKRIRHRAQMWCALGTSVLIAAGLGAIAPILPELALDYFRQALQTKPQGSEFVHQGTRSFPVFSPQRVIVIGRMLEEIERQSKPGERLFVGPGDLRRPSYCDTFIYHLLPKLYPATYFLEMNPLSVNRPGSRLASDIRSADWLVLNHEWDLREEPNRSREYGSAEPADVVKENFQFIGVYGTFGLFRRKH
jgi:hypothetical protein